MLRKILGFAPKLEFDGSYSPSKMALKIGVSDQTDFENIVYKKYQVARVIFREVAFIINFNWHKFLIHSMSDGCYIWIKIAYFNEKNTF